jgi:hypothetical protein
VVMVMAGGPTGAAVMAAIAIVIATITTGIRTGARGIGTSARAPRSR